MQCIFHCYRWSKNFDERPHHRSRIFEGNVMWHRPVWSTACGCRSPAVAVIDFLLCKAAQHLLLMLFSGPVIYQNCLFLWKIFFDSCIKISQLIHVILWKTNWLMVCNLNCLIKTKGLVKVTGSHVGPHCTFDNISVDDRRFHCRTLIWPPRITAPANNSSCFDTIHARDRQTYTIATTWTLFAVGR